MASTTTLKLSPHDQALVDAAVTAMRSAFENAHAPPAVAKRIAVLAVRQRNKGRAAAIRRHPFCGVCEQSGRPLQRQDAVLDEVEPERGYAGRVRWVCHKANNSGKRSCGAC
jgi:hypothetical protein